MPSGVYERTAEHRRSLSLINLGRKHTPEHNAKVSASMKGRKCWYVGLPVEKHPHWKGGVTEDKKYQANQHKEYRHRLGISKRYRNMMGGFSKKYHNQKYKYNKKNAGKLSIETIQMVYEDNIKQFGTLTCYLCLTPITFKKDHLEHKIPLSRGGTNEYGNLAIACQTCNCRKHAKTEAEYRKEL